MRPAARVVSYRDAEVLAARLAARLVDRCGPAVRDARFVAVPRGGFVVLGLLAYTLGVAHHRLLADAAGEPTVVVDDCSLTGDRFAAFLARLEAPRVVFAHLLSHPALRRAVEKAEPRVVACVAGGDLAAWAPDRDAEEHRRRWRDRLGRRRYWTGGTEPVAFAWNEPDRLAWSPRHERVVAGWRMAPPDATLGSAVAFGLPPGARAAGAWRLASGVAWRLAADGIELRRGRDGCTFALGEVETAMLRGLLLSAAVEGASAAVEARFAVSRQRAAADLLRFAEELAAKGLLERRRETEADPAPRDV